MCGNCGTVAVLPLPHQREKKSFFIFMEILAVESHHRPSKWNVIFNVSHQIQQNKIVNIILTCGVLFNAVFFYLILLLLLLFFFLIVFGWFSLTDTALFWIHFPCDNFRLLTLQTENKKEINAEKTHQETPTTQSADTLHNRISIYTTMWSVISVCAAGNSNWK